MKLPRLTSGAVEDAETAAENLTCIAPSLGAAFKEAFRDALQTIQLTPRRYGRLETNKSGRELRRIILDRFNYLVIYEIVNDLPCVLAVVHASRQPDAWRERPN